MRQYLDLLQKALDEGVWQQNRTGVPCKSMPGAMLQFKLAEGFPLLTTKKIFYKSVAAELVGFIRGYSNSADFEALGTKIWSANANENASWVANPARKGQGDLGRIYGVQWTDWRGQLVIQSPDEVESLGASDLRIGSEGVVVESVNQLRNAIDQIINNPTSRRIIVSAWRPDELDQMALPPCHVMHQYLVDTVNRKLHLCMYQRSCDLFLGIPFNIASYAMLLSAMADVTGYDAGTLTMHLADVHIYENHLKQVQEQLSRTPSNLPRLAYTSGLFAGDGSFTGRFETATSWQALQALTPESFVFENYNPQPAIKAPMAV